MYYYFQPLNRKKITKQEQFHNYISDVKKETTVGAGDTSNREKNTPRTRTTIRKSLLVPPKTVGGILKQQNKDNKGSIGSCLVSAVLILF